MTANKNFICSNIYNVFINDLLTFIGGRKTIGTTKKNVNLKEGIGCSQWELYNKREVDVCNYALPTYASLKVENKGYYI